MYFQKDTKALTEANKLFLPKDEILAYLQRLSTCEKTTDKY